MDAVGAHDVNEQDRDRIGLARRMTLLARMPLLRERHGMVVMVVASGEAKKESNEVKISAYTTMHNTTVDAPQAVYSRWIFLRLYSVEVIVALIYLCMKYNVEIVWALANDTFSSRSGSWWFFSGSEWLAEAFCCFFGR